MKLLIISNMSHYLRDGQIVGWGPTVREIDHLANIFHEIRHVACLHSNQAPDTSLPYSSQRVTLIPVQPAGGRTFKSKLAILAKTPNYISVMKEQLRWADAVHVRCTANISLIAILLLSVVRTPQYRWVKYAENWSPGGAEPFSYTLQRWWLKKNFHHGIVTVNGKWIGQPAHVHSFLNPCLTNEELQQARMKANGKKLSPPFYFLFAGRVESRKGVNRAIEIVAELQKKNLPFHFDIVGEGAERSYFEEKSTVLGLTKKIQFHGWLPRQELDSLYSRSHFLLFPSAASEGWPKVLGEAMAYGVIPIAGAVSSIPQILENLQTGVALPVNDTERFVDEIMNYVHNPERWNLESQRAITGSVNFTYSNYLRELDHVFQQMWGINLPRLNDA